MIRQRVEHAPLTGWRGVALILLIALLVIALSNIFSALERVLGSMAASFLFILCGMAVAGFLLNRYVLGYLYVCENGCLHVSRVYGKRHRPMADIWLNGVQACGEPDAIRKRFPGAKIQRATRADCPLSPMAVAYRDDGQTAILLLQPNDALARTPHKGRQTKSKTPRDLSRSAFLAYSDHL